MSRVIRGIFYVFALMVGVAILARLPVSNPLIEGLALVLFGVIIVLNEWPRWAPGHDHQWPNKLGQY